MTVKTTKEYGTNQPGNMLVDRTEYLTSGVHIGMKTCTKYMRQFVYKIRDDGLAVFNIQMVDERIRMAAKFLSNFDSIMIVSRKGNGITPSEKMADVLDGKAIAGRFPPGTLTNPSFRNFYEPDVIFLVDPLVDKQAITEAKRKRIPVIALCDTFNEASDVDLIIPANNNGRKSLALICWIMTREILKNKGKIKENSEYAHTLQDFGAE